MQLTRILREGFIAGLIGAGAVALWFLIVDTIAAVLAAEVEVAPPTLYLVVVFFAIFEFGFYVTVAILAQPLLGSLAWWNVAIGNAIAAYGMGYYLWRQHPKIAETLKLHPLGETDEGE